MTKYLFRLYFKELGKALAFILPSAEYPKGYHVKCPALDGYCAGTVSVETVTDNSNTFKFPVRPCPTDSAEPEERPLHK